MTQASTSPDRAAGLARVLRVSALTAVTIGLAGAYPTFMQGGHAAVQVMTLALAIALLGSLLGSLATMKFPVQHPADGVSAVMLGLGVRFGVSLVPTAGLVLAEAVPGSVLVLWVGLGKLVLLLVDTLGLLRAMRPAAACEAGAGR
jgi:hypothetical protein